MIIDVPAVDPWTITDTLGATPRISITGAIPPGTDAVIRSAEQGWGYLPAVVDANSASRGSVWVGEVSVKGLSVSCERLSPLHGTLPEWGNPGEALAKFRFPGATLGLEGTLSRYTLPYQANISLTGAAMLEIHRQYVMARLRADFPSITWVLKAHLYGANYAGAYAAGDRPNWDYEMLNAYQDPYDDSTVEFRLLVWSSYEGTGTWNGTTDAVFLVRGYLPKAKAPWLKSVDNLYNPTVEFQTMVGANIDDFYHQTNVNRVVVEPEFAHFAMSPSLVGSLPGVTNVDGWDMTRVRVVTDPAKRAGAARLTVSDFTTRPAVPASPVYVPDGNGSGRHLLFGRMLTGPVFCTEVTFQGNVSVDPVGRAISVVPVTRGVMFPGSLVAKLDADTSALGDAQVTALNIIVANYPAVQRVVANPISKLEVYRRAAEAGEEGLATLRDSVLVQAAEDAPSVTLGQASGRASGKEFTVATYFSPKLVAEVGDTHVVDETGATFVIIDGARVPVTDDEVLAAYLLGDPVLYEMVTGTLQLWMNGIAGTTVVAGSLSRLTGSEFEEASLADSMELRRDVWPENVRAARDITQFTPNRSIGAELLSASYSFGNVAVKRYKLV